MTAMLSRSMDIRKETEEQRRQLATDGAPPELEDTVKMLLRKSRWIHVAFIFDKTFGECDTWYHVMHMMNATTLDPINYDKGLEAFATHLDFTFIELKSIMNAPNLPTYQDQVTNILLAFAQRPDATLDKVVAALNAMGRFDILNKIKKSLAERCDRVLQANSEVLVSGDSGFSESEICSVIRPTYTPDVPALLKSKEDLHFNLLHTQLVQKVPTPYGILEHRGLVEAPDEGYENDASPLQLSSIKTCNSSSCSPESNNFDVTVMLTFAEDGRETAMKTAAVLRATMNEEGEHIGVVILGEQLRHLNADPHDFIRRAFKQVDYVMPIITPEYLQITPHNGLSMDGSDCVDAVYARFIYKLMDNYYTDMHCANKKIRTLIPPNTDNSIVNIIKDNPIFKPFSHYKNLVNVAKKMSVRNF